MPALGFSAVKLKGKDLSTFPDGNSDIGATYWLEHHVPDNLGAVREMVRVLRPGGVLFIDHELAPAHWRPSAEYKAYRTAMRPPRSIWKRMLNLTKPRWYMLRARLLLNPRYAPEGDI